MNEDIEWWYRPCRKSIIVLYSFLIIDWLVLWIRIPFRWGVLDTHYVIKFVTDLKQVSGFFLVLRFPPISPTNNTERHAITEILLKVALNTIKPKPRYNHNNWLIKTMHYTFWDFLEKIYITNVWGNLTINAPFWEVNYEV